MQIVKFGHNKLNYLEGILEKYKPSNILLLTGKSSYINSGSKETLLPFLNHYKHIQYSDFEENPKIEDVESVVNIFNNNNCDFIIAIGGGSVMDMAKLVNYFAKKEAPFKDKFNDSLTKSASYPMVAIPTTSGTGSEATHFAVVYSKGIKYSIADNNLLPNYVFLLPHLTYNNPNYLSAVTGLDAFAQAIESYWSVNSTDESKEYSKKAINLIWNNLETIINNNSVAARDKLMEASYIAGKAINITKTTAPHALSYGFTSICGLPHGHAVSLFIPYIIQKNIDVTEANCNDKRGVKYVKNNLLELSKMVNSNINNFAQDIHDFFLKCHIEISFSSLNIDETIFNKALNNLSQERLSNNPVILEIDKLSDIFKSRYNNA